MVPMPLQFFGDPLKPCTVGLLAHSSGMVTKPRSWVLLAVQRPAVCDALRRVAGIENTQTRQAQHQYFAQKN